MDVPLKPIRSVADWTKPSIPGLAPANGKKINILIVDDQAANLFALENLLDNPDYSIVRAFTGPEALRYMLQLDFALVLLDVLMPGMDGFETAGLIRQRPQSKHTPIIFITASSSNENHVNRGYSLGAVDYIYKPIIPEILKAKVQVFVELYKKTVRLSASEEALRQELAEREKIEQARRDSEERYRELFTKANDAVIVFNADTHQVVDANRAALRLFGYARPEFMKLVERDLWAPDQPPETESDEKGAVIRIQKKRDGEVFPAEINYSRITVRGQRLILAINHDIRERLKAKEADRLREREALQRQLVATVSHELRTPIAAIKASAETMRRGGLVDANNRPRFIKIIENQADRLAWLVEDLLAVAELEAGKAQPEPRPIYLMEFVENFIREIAPLAARRSITISVDIPEKMELWIDQAHLGRILQNLLDNAIKYNRPGGSISIKARKFDSRNVQVSIHDSGIGIASEELSLIFEQFHRSVRAKEHSAKGTGLGLYIIKRIMESNGGRIWAESEHERGSTFHFTVPIPRRVGPAS